MHEHKSMTLEAGNKGCVGDRDDLERKEGREESLQRGCPGRSWQSWDLEGALLRTLGDYVSRSVLSDF